MGGCTGKPKKPNQTTRPQPNQKKDPSNAGQPKIDVGPNAQANKPNVAPNLKGTSESNAPANLNQNPSLGKKDLLPRPSDGGMPLQPNNSTQQLSQQPRSQYPDNAANHLTSQVQKSNNPNSQVQEDQNEANRPNQLDLNIIKSLTLSNNLDINPTPVFQNDQFLINKDQPVSQFQANMYQPQQQTQIQTSQVQSLSTLVQNRANALNGSTVSPQLKPTNSKMKLSDISRNAPQSNLKAGEKEQGKFDNPFADVMVHFDKQQDPMQMNAFDLDNINEVNQGDKKNMNFYMRQSQAQGSQMPNIFDQHMKSIIQTHQSSVPFNSHIEQGIPQKQGEYYVVETFGFSGKVS